MAQFALHHVSVIVTDLPRSLAFYQKLFGFTTIERPPFKIVFFFLKKKKKKKTRRLRVIVGAKNSQSSRLMAWDNLEAEFCINAIVRQPQNEAMKTPDPQLRQQVVAAKHKKYDEAFNKNDASGVVALFTEDIVFVTPTGPIYGREATEKWYADFFRKYHPSGHIGMPDQYSPHVISTVGNRYAKWGF